MSIRHRDFDDHFFFFQDACSHDPKRWLFFVNTSWYIFRGNLIWPICSARRALKVDHFAHRGRSWDVFSSSMYLKCHIVMFEID